MKLGGGGDDHRLGDVTQGRSPRGAGGSFVPLGVSDVIEVTGGDAGPRLEASWRGWGVQLEPEEDACEGKSGHDTVKTFIMASTWLVESRKVTSELVSLDCGLCFLMCPPVSFYISLLFHAEMVQVFPSLGKMCRIIVPSC